jgi:hypothetical protein
LQDQSDQDQGLRRAAGAGQRSGRAVHRENRIIEGFLSVVRSGRVASSAG